MIVVRHEAPGVTEPVDHLRQDAQKLHAIFVVFEDRLTPITAGRDVIKRAGEFDAEGSDHARSILTRMLQCET